MNTVRDAAALKGWRKSSYSENGSGGCVEITDAYRDGIPIRDSKDPNGPALIFPTRGWTSFVSAVKGDSLP